MTGFVMVLTLAVVAYFLITGTMSLQTARRAEMLATQERTRSEFAELRHQLFDLVRRGRLDVRSETFLLLWDICSAMVRAPWHYQFFADRERAWIIENHDREGPDALPAWVREFEHWPREIPPLLVGIADAMQRFLFHYPSESRLRRWIVRNLPMTKSAERFAHLWHAEIALRQAANRHQTHDGRTPTPPPMAVVG